MNWRRAAAAACACLAGFAAAVAAPRRARGDGPETAGSTAAAGAGPREETAVTIAVDQPILTLGMETGTNLVVKVTGPLAAGAVPARTLATVGEIGPLIPLANDPGAFTAAYRVPADYIPQSAIIAAELLLTDGRLIHATTRVLLPAATTVPLRTSPAANVSLEIAGTVFGPLRADAEGNVNIPVVVPPHVAVGRARAVNRFGIAKETDVDLQLRDYPRILLIAPPGAEAGDTVEVEAWAVGPSGDPSPPEEIDLRAEAGMVRRIGGIPGLARFAFTLPPQVSAGAVGLLASMEDGSSVRADTMLVRAGAPSDVLIAADLRHLVVGSGAVAHLTVIAQDRFGNAVPVDGVAVRADGAPVPVRVTAAEASAEVSAPAAWSGRDHLDIEAALGGLRASRQLRVSGGSPRWARLTASRPALEGNDRNAVEFVVEVSDARGTPSAATRIFWRTDEEGTLEPHSSARLGTYSVRFIPRPTLRDRWAQVSVKVDTTVEARARVLVQAGGARDAAARVGLMSNLGGSFGQSAFVEVTWPLGKLGRLGRLFSAGLTLGYLHAESDIPAGTSALPTLQLNVDQSPVLALARLRIPGELPVQFSLSGAAGMTFATATIAPDDQSFARAQGTARALVLGAGVDASILLQPGELIIGARYLHAHLGRISSGDQIEGNALGLVCDLGFRLAF